MTADKLDRLRDRAKMLRASREFFYSRGVMEVDCPILCSGAIVDTHIDLLVATNGSDNTFYLHPSAEAGMKRLLAEGMGDIFQLSHVFRDGECGNFHNPEFMMAEWYREGLTFGAMIEETAEFVRLYLGKRPLQVISYREAFLKCCQLDPLEASDRELYTYVIDNQVANHLTSDSLRDDILNAIFAVCIENSLGADGTLTAITHYPASQAALACVVNDGKHQVAERFELYAEGVELSNGYHELANAKEQLSRFKEANRARVALGKATVTPDRHLLTAMEEGLPDCCGVAVGIDRLLMLRQQTRHIDDVLPFSWSRI